VLSSEGPQVVRIVVAGSMGWAVCVAVGLGPAPLYAVIVPLVAMREDPFSAMSVSTARLIGVVAGLSVGIAILHLLRPNALAVALVLAAGLLVGMALRAGGGMNIQVAISGLLVFANANPDSYAFTGCGRPRSAQP
jgi:uncharacterized membrane protein YgaE (UPF0421/DUF939 family)